MQSFGQQSFQQPSFQQQQYQQPLSSYSGGGGYQQSSPYSNAYSSSSYANYPSLSSYSNYGANVAAQCPICRGACGSTCYPSLGSSSSSRGIPFTSGTSSYGSGLGSSSYGSGLGSSSYGSGLGSSSYSSFPQQQQFYGQQQPFYGQQQQQPSYGQQGSSLWQNAGKANAVGKSDNIKNVLKKKSKKNRSSSTGSTTSVAGISSALVTAGVAGLIGSVFAGKANTISGSNATLAARPQGALPHFARNRPMSWKDSSLEDTWTWETYYDTGREKWAHERF